MELIFWAGMIAGAIAGSLDKNNRIAGAAGGAFIGLFISSVFWLVSGLFIIDITDNYESNFYDYKEEKHYITAINDGQSTRFNGRFFLGSGNVGGGGMAYYAYAEVGKDKYKQVSFNPDNCIIVEDIDSTERPYYIQIRTRLKKEVWDGIKKWDRWSMGPTMIDKEKGYEIHIPKGSILTNFNFDLK